MAGVRGAHHAVTKRPATFEVRIGNKKFLARVSDWFSIRISPPCSEPGYYQITSTYMGVNVSSRWWTGRQWKRNPRGMPTIFGGHPKDKWRGIELIKEIP